MEFMTLIDRMDIVSMFVPVDSQTGGNPATDPSKWIDLSYYKAVIFVYHHAKGVAGDDPVFLLEQAKTNAGGSKKNLNYARFRYKRGTGGAEVNAVSAITEMICTGAESSATFTARTDTNNQPAARGQSFVDALGAENESVMWVIVRATDLDVQNGFSHARFSIADTGAGGAQLHSGLAICIGARYAGFPNQSAIA